MTRLNVVGALVFLLLSKGLAQQPSFEVVSIKANNTGTRNGGIGVRGGSLEGTNVTLKMLLIYAYSPSNGQIMDQELIGMPKWADTERFDIQARPHGGAPVLPGEHTTAMVQSMLQDRFQLRAHHETRGLPVYELVLTNGGPKLSTDQTPPDARNAWISIGSEGDKGSPLPRGGLRLIMGRNNNGLKGTAVSISALVRLLQTQSDRIIVDKTGLDSQLMDVDLEFSGDDLASTREAQEGGVDSENAPGKPTAQSVFTAIRGIGLKLNSARAPRRALVIDSVERPSGN